MRSLDQILADNSDEGIERHRRLALAMNRAPEKPKRAAKAAKRKERHVD